MIQQPLLQMHLLQPTLSLCSIYFGYLFQPTTHLFLSTRPNWKQGCNFQQVQTAFSSILQNWKNENQKSIQKPEKQTLNILHPGMQLAFSYILLEKRKQESKIWKFFHWLLVMLCAGTAVLKASWEKFWQAEYESKKGCQ